MHTAIHRPRAESARHVLRGLWCGGGLIRSEPVLSRIASRCRPNQPSRPAPSWRAARTCPEPTPLARVSRSWRSACGAQGRHRTHIIARPRAYHSSLSDAPVTKERRAAVVRVVRTGGLVSPSHLAASGTRACERSTRSPDHSSHTREMEQDKAALAADGTMECSHAADGDGPEGCTTDGVGCTCVPQRGSAPTAQRTGDRGPRRTCWSRGPAWLVQGVDSFRTTWVSPAGCMSAVDAARAGSRVRTMDGRGLRRTSALRIGHRL